MLTLLAAILATAAPVYFAITMASKLSLDAQSSSSMLHALDPMQRSERTAYQAKVAFDKLASVDGEPCSEAAVEVMCEIGLGSSYLQAIGYYENEHLLWSSMSISEPLGVMMGPVDRMTSNGVGIRKNFSYPFATDLSFVLRSKSTHIAIIHKDLPIDTTTLEDGVFSASVVAMIARN